MIRGAAFKSVALAEKLENKGFEAAALAEEGVNPVATVANDFELKSTNAYIEGRATDIVIPISALFGSSYWRQ